jgi:hypothetical protein
MKMQWLCLSQSLRTDSSQLTVVCPMIFGHCEDALYSVSQNPWVRVAEHAYDPSTWEAEAGGS